MKQLQATKFDGYFFCFGVEKKGFPLVSLLFIETSSGVYKIYTVKG